MFIKIIIHTIITENCQLFSLLNSLIKNNTDIPFFDTFHTISPEQFHEQMIKSKIQRTQIAFTQLTTFQTVQQYWYTLGPDQFKITTSDAKFNNLPNIRHLGLPLTALKTERIASLRQHLKERVKRDLTTHKLPQISYIYSANSQYQYCCYCS